MCDAVGEHFTIVLGDGVQYRVRLPSSLSSPLAQACIDALACAVPTQLCYDLRIDIFQCQKQHNLDDFDALVSVLLASMNPDTVRVLLSPKSLLALTPVCCRYRPSRLRPMRLLVRGRSCYRATSTRESLRRHHPRSLTL